MELKLKTRFLQAVVVVGLLAMLFVLLEKVFWVARGSLALDAGPIPWTYTQNALLLVGVVASAATLWKWPWVSLIVAWMNLIVLLGYWKPWRANSSVSFLRGFAFDHIFFVAANVGAAAVTYLKRGRESPQLSRR